MNSGFLKEKFNELENKFNNLLNDKLINEEDFEKFLETYSKETDEYEEITLKNYINFQRNVEGKEYEEALKFSQENIKPLLKTYKMELEKKELNYIGENPKKEYLYLEKILTNKRGLSSLDNISISKKEDELINKYLKFIGNLKSSEDQETSIEDKYAELYNSDEQTRKSAYIEISNAYINEKEYINKIFDSLTELRTLRARNLKLDSFTDLAFRELERLDYSPVDCDLLAQKIKTFFVPLKKEFQYKQLQYLGKSALAPWDQRISPYSMETSLFSDQKELISATKKILNEIDPYFKQVLEETEDLKNLDLDIRNNKASGGFSEFLPYSKESFIFMNSNGTFDDLVILIHEIGHAIHHDLIKNISLYQYKDISLEVAEFAAMSLELISMDHWGIIFKNESELNKAKLEHLRLIVEFLPQTVIVDQFQQKLYSNLNQEKINKDEIFGDLVDKYDTGLIDWNSVEKWKSNEWMSVIHIFESPFYYIEYAIAQIAALQLYKNYKENPVKTIRNFKNALALGRTKPLKEIFELAGVKMILDDNEMNLLVDFIKDEINYLEGKIKKWKS